MHKCFKNNQIQTFISFQGGCFEHVFFFPLFLFSKGILELTGTCSKNLLHHLLAEILLSWIYIVLKGHWLFKS